MDEEKIRKFLKIIYSDSRCKEHIDNGRLDKALLLFYTYRNRKRWNQAGYNWIPEDIFYNFYDNSISKTIENINKVVGTNFTCSLKGTSGDKYYIAVKVYNPNWTAPVKRFLLTKFSTKGNYILTVNTSRSSDGCLLLFNTEQEALKFLNASELLQRAAYKDGEPIIEMIPVKAYSSTISINDSPEDAITLNETIFVKNKKIGDAIVPVSGILYNGPDVWKEVEALYDL